MGKGGHPTPPNHVVVFGGRSLLYGMPPLPKLAYAWPCSPDCGIGRLAYCPWFGRPIGAIGGMPYRPNPGLVPC